MAGIGVRMPMSPISPAHFEALDHIIPAFEKARIWYRATGGLAGNLHGSVWPLHDIDLDYRRADWPWIEELLGPHLLTPPVAYKDEEFKLTMAKAKIGAVDIELCQLEDCFVAGPSGWHLLDPNPNRRERRTWQYLTLWTLSVEDLVHYKELIGRNADLADLKKVALAQNSRSPDERPKHR